ncbi:hypothetical protein FQN57_002619 [Myotisia sp. PD_48]|nr:hypothetical protein FQN57_002619 [Myotisia sp. PD_48]
MTLEDFEKELAEKHKKRADREKRSTSGHEKSDHRRHHDHRDRVTDHTNRHHGHENGRRHKRSRHINKHHDDNGRDYKRQHRDRTSDSERDTNPVAARPPIKDETKLQRDKWMEAPSALDIDFIHRSHKTPQEQPKPKMLQVDFEQKLHEKELNRHLFDIDATQSGSTNLAKPNEVDYTFGDAGSRWRMTKLKAVYRQAREGDRQVEDVALERYGNLRLFDDAREEETELDRRDTYGKDYVGKEKPTGELFSQRGVDTESTLCSMDPGPDVWDMHLQKTQGPLETTPPPTEPVDASELNRFKAQVMRAKLRGAPEANELEARYNSMVAASQGRKESEAVVVLGVMDNRMLASGRRAEIRPVDSKKAREKGLVEENEDMSIEDMVREERRNRGKGAEEGLRFAERIAKDGIFANDLDYMEEHASKLAKHVQRSDINIKNMAINEFQRLNRILDRCPLCYHEDSGKTPVAPVVSLATRVYLTLPTEPELNDGSSCIVPIQHRNNLLECDDDEWEEIRNFMKCLTRMYHDQGRGVIFYENAARPEQKRHAAMEAVPLPYSLEQTAPAFFKEAILAADEEWTQHKKLIDTLSRSREGLGKRAFRQTLAKEMPYFHVWFELDGGLGHVIDDPNRWPRGDLFAREIIGGMLDLAPDVIKRQGRRHRGDDRRVDGFKKRWKKFDWTRVLTGG